MGEVQLYYNDIAKVLVEEDHCSIIEQAMAVIESLPICDDDRASTNDDEETSMAKHYQLIQLIAYRLDVSCRAIHIAVNRFYANYPESEASTTTPKHQQSRHDNNHEDSDVETDNNDD